MFEWNNTRICAEGVETGLGGCYGSACQILVPSVMVESVSRAGEGRTVPILTVQIPRNDLIFQSTHCAQHAAVLAAIRRSQPFGPDAQDLFEGLLEARDFGLDAGGALACEVFVGPGVRGDLMPRVVGPNEV